MADIHTQPASGLAQHIRARAAARRGSGFSCHSLYPQGLPPRAELEGLLQSHTSLLLPACIAITSSCKLLAGPSHLPEALSWLILPHLSTGH